MTTMTEAVFLSGIAVAMVMIFGFVLWNAVAATTIGDFSVSEKRQVNRKVEAMAREQRRHDRAMRRIRKRRR